MTSPSHKIQVFLTLLLTKQTTRQQHDSRQRDSDNATADTSPKFIGVTPLADVPQNCLKIKILKDSIREVYGFIDIRPFQIESINHLAFDDDSSLVLIRRTANGKSLVPLTVTIIRGGVILILVPLHGLGSNQVNKATSTEHGIEAYFVDEHKYYDVKVLEKRLLHRAQLNTTVFISKFLEARIQMDQIVQDISFVWVD